MKTSLLVICLSLIGCASMNEFTIRDAPSINTENIHVPQLDNISPRQVNLTVTDNRAPEFKKNSDAVIVELRRAVISLIDEKNIAVKPNAPNSLNINIQDHKTADYQEGCVKLTAVLFLQKKGKVHADAFSCFEYKHPLGYNLNSDISKAYEAALQALLDQLDKGLLQL